MANDPGYEEIRDELSTKLMSWMMDTHDPLVNGKVIPPEGALMNYPHSASPAEKVFIKNWEELL